jgi:FAD/FMN-containing dehydrogenase
MASAIDQAYRALKRQFQGELLRPSDETYEQARLIWNGMAAKTPGLIARCAHLTDVQTVVRAASSFKVLTAVRCGGHSLAGFSTCEGGLVIDLSRMRAVAVEPERRRARFAGGCLLADIDAATQPYGLAFPAGVVSHTGASGLVLGGGFGWLTRYGGLSCDNVEGFTVVTADGALLRADERENSDLFWALRGGGGNFGVVTDFRVRLHPVTSVLLAEATCVADEIPGLLRSWREFMPEAPERLKWNISLSASEDNQTAAREPRGRQPLLKEVVVWIGSSEQGEAYIEQALSLARHVDVTRRVLSFVELQTMADHEFPHGWRYYTKSGYFRSLDDTSIERMLQALSTIPSMTQIELAYLGGAAQRIKPDETAFGDRSSPFVINLLAKWSDASEDARNITWVRKLFEVLRPAMTPGVHINFMSGDEQDRVPEAYHQHWGRLVTIKSKCDPRNLFRLNQNIPPRKIASDGLAL